MARQTTRTTHDDAPLAQAKNPDATASADAGPRTEHDDTLIGRTVTIGLPRAELYAFWRDFRNLAAFMENVERIDVQEPGRSHWVVRAPAGKTVEWVSLVTEDVPNERIAWQTTEDSKIRHSGSVEFRDSHNRRGTEVTATIVYHPPAASVGKAIAKLFQREPKIQTRRELRRFKQLMETGEIATSTPQAAAPRGD